VENTILIFLFALLKSFEENNSVGGMTTIIHESWWIIRLFIHCGGVFFNFSNIFKI
jgi:hypothetical protein